MSSNTPTNRESFTIFRSAAEEAAMKVEERNLDNEGGRTRSKQAFVNHRPGAELPYIVLLSRSPGLSIERSFATMREAEAFIRQNAPGSTPTLSTLYDRPASET